MNKILFFICTICFFSCSKEFETTNVELNFNNSSLRNVDEARAIAENAADFGKTASTRNNGNSKQIEPNYVAITLPKTRSIYGNQDTLLYVFNYMNNEGFAVISASKQTIGLIAVTELGHFSSLEECENKALVSYLRSAAYEIQNVESASSFVVAPDTLTMLRVQNDTIYKKNITPLLTVKWGQRNPEGYYCSNNVAGCANTAIAMIMSYYRYPTSLQLTYDGAGSSSLTLDWTNICRHTQSRNYDTDLYCCNSTTHDSLAKLCRQLGVLTNSTYFNGDGINGPTTGSNNQNIFDALQTLGFETSSILDYSTGIQFVNSLSQNKLLIVSGLSTESEDGHVWVVDGCKYLTIERKEYSSKDHGITWNLDLKYNISSNYNHINWGASGLDNGYFLDGSFVTNQGNQYDNPNQSYHSECNFSRDVKYIIVNKQ